MAKLEVAQIAKKLRLGLEELLKPGARVLYENVFSTRHIGRVIDFLLYESRTFIEAHPDAGYAEYRLRHAVELGIFNGWSNFKKGEKSKCIELELGFDDEKLVVAVAFYVDADVTNFTPGDAEAPSGAVAERMQKMLTQVQELSDGLLVRHEPTTGRVQVMAFISAGANEKLVDTQCVTVDINDDSEPPRPDASVPNPLAAADVEGFVKDESEGLKSSKALDAMDALSVVKGAPETVDDTATKVKGSKGEKEAVMRVKGSGSGELANKDILRVKSMGVGEKTQDETKLVVKGDGLSVAAAEKLKIPASALDNVTAEAAVAAESKYTSESQADEGDPNTDESVEVLLSTVRAEIVPLCPGLSEDQFEEAFRNLSTKIRENYNQTLHHMLRVKNIQMIGKIKHYKDQLQLLNARIEELKAENNDLLESLAQKDATEAEILKLKNSSDPKLKDKRDQEEARARETIQQYQTSIEKGEVPNGAKDWGKGLLEAALKERAFLSQRSREIEAILKKREYDYKNKESTLKEELRLKEEQVRQKEFTLIKTKEALANAMQNADKARALADLGSADKNEIVQKLSTAEKLLSVSKENNERMAKRVEDVQKKWQEEFNSRSAITQEKSKLQKEADDLRRKLTTIEERGTHVEELAKLTQARDRSVRIIDDLKRQIKELQAKLSGSSAQAKPGAAVADQKKHGGQPQMGEGEFKHKLDQANKISAAMKEELERTKKRFDELKQSETKLRVEVAKLQADLKAAGKNPQPEKAQPKPQKSSTSSPLIKPKNVKMSGGGNTGGAKK